LTYGELDRRTNQLAHYLQRLGIGPDDIVGLCVERSADMIVGLLGILKAGAGYLPLDPYYPPDRLASMLEDSSVSLVMIHSPLRACIAGHICDIVEIDVAWPEIAREPATAVAGGP